MSAYPEPRFSYDRLWRLAGCPSPEELGRRTGIHSRQWQRWKAAGVSKQSADRAAVLLGYHPAEVWPEWLAA